MNIEQSQKSHLIINLDLLFDFYSVLFSAYRTYFVKYPTTINDLKHLIEGKSYEQGLIALLKEVAATEPLSVVKEGLHEMVRMSISSIKPNIGAYTLLTDLVKNKINIQVFSHFEKEILSLVREAHKDWFHFDILEITEASGLQTAFESLDKSSVLLVDSSMENCLSIKNDLAIQTVFLPHSKTLWKEISESDKQKEVFLQHSIQSFETLDKVDWTSLGVTNTVKWPEPSYYLQLNNKPTNLEFNVWGNIVKFDKSIELTSDIVHGFGRGGKKLGIPTANLSMTTEIEEKLCHLVSGVYYGWAEFEHTTAKVNEDVEYNNKYPMVMSIGFNPYFNNKHKTAEAHIMKSFEKDFYGSKITVTILGFIRNEADFLSFAHLIEAIHNDVQLTKNVLDLNSQSFLLSSKQ